MDFFGNNSLSWEKYAKISPDGAVVCTGINSGVIKEIEDKASNVKRMHCFYIDNLWWPKTYLKNLPDILNAVTKCVNYIKARPLNQRLFSFLCDELHADQTGLLWYTEGITYHVSRFSSKF